MRGTRKDAWCIGAVKRKKGNKKFPIQNWGQ